MLIKKKRYQYFLSACVIVTLCCCTSNKGKELPLFDNELEYTLLSETNRYIFDEIYQPFGGFQAIDGKLYIAETIGEDVAFHILTIDEVNGRLEYEKGLGSKGQGPGEFNLIYDIIDADSLIWMYDSNQLKLVSYDKKTGQLAPVDDILLKTGGGLTNIYSAGEDRFVGIGIITDNRFNIMDRNGNEVIRHGDQIIFNDNFSTRDISVSWISVGTVHPEGEYVYLFATNADFIEQYNKNGQVIKRIQGSEHPVPEMELVDLNGGGGAWPFNVDGVLAYINVASDDHYIYGLYSGIKGRGNLMTGMLAGNIIHKFDWDLNLVEAYQLDQEIMQLAVDGKGNLYAYAMTDEGLIEFYHYELF